jgi:PAS domain S-box-containing protein
VVIDLEGTILYINRVEKGYDREQVLGMKADVILPPESKATFWAVLDTVARKGVTEEYVVEASSPSGETQHYRSRMSPLHDEVEVVGAVIIATNVTELKSAQAEVERLRHLLPLCSWCGKIQDESGVWLTIEAHLERERGTKVSHVMCLDCNREHFGDDRGAEERNRLVTSARPAWSVEAPRTTRTRRPHHHSNGSPTSFAARSHVAEGGGRLWHAEGSGSPRLGGQRE